MSTSNIVDNADKYICDCCKRNMSNTYYENKYVCNCELDDSRYNCIDDTMDRFIHCKKFDDVLKTFPELEILKLKRQNSGEQPTKQFKLQFNPDEFQLPVTKGNDHPMRIIKYLTRNNITGDIYEICEDSADSLIIHIAFYNYIIKFASYKYYDSYYYNLYVGMLNDYIEECQDDMTIRNLTSDETFNEIKKYFVGIDINPLKIWYKEFTTSENNKIRDSYGLKPLN